VEALAELELVARGDEVTVPLGLSGGAGKTTLVRPSTSLVGPDRGRLRAAGLEWVRRII
jgi:ABC-type Na+ transport system ATPase subunit NatA